MSGHSKWSKIKHQKKKEDSRRGKIFTKLSRALAISAREGGGDPEFNSALRIAIESAKAENMPKENIEKAIKRGTGELPGISYERAVYEGYGPAGTAIMIETLTDNKNRTVAEIRNIFSKNNGNIGENGCVSWMFDKRGMITIKKNDHSEEDIIDIALEAGALDVDSDNELFQVFTEINELDTVRATFEEHEIQAESMKPCAIPKSTVKIDEKDAMKLLKLLESLEEHDDVQEVFSNFEIDDDIIDKFYSE